MLEKFREFALFSSILMSGLNVSFSLMKSFVKFGNPKVGQPYL